LLEAVAVVVKMEAAAEAAAEVIENLKDQMLLPYMQLHL
tara:strand:- start:464 stop:580 length:117 start_codon:yes stop_codon:yes gene_type:complete